ncbi:hypothetical protein [Parvibaculum sp.]|uniref:hypothetical protein n=1 Tax=Parvibaculum sp. TaxID=2024848 RepID=UPI0039194AE4
MSNGFEANGGQGGAQADKGQTAWSYGRNAEPFPELHVFSRLSELDAAYAAELARRRARQETLEREIAGLAKHLAAPLEGVSEEAPKKKGFFSRRAKA